MSREFVGEYELVEIDKRIDRLLKDLGNPEPPLRLDQVRDLLRMDLKYYTLSDTTFFDNFKHKLTIGAKQIAARPGLMFEAVREANLSAICLPDEKKIFIDKDIPKPKHRWIEAHEISHAVIDWHRDFMLGDNALTLSQSCDQLIESEANYGAGRLLFLGDRFSEELRAEKMSFKSIKSRASAYGNSIQSTLWRSVEETHSQRAIFGMVSAHPHHHSVGGREYGETPKFIRSERFRQQFSNIEPQDVFSVLQNHARRNKGGPVVHVNECLIDLNGERFEFEIESFSNTHALLTYGICTRKLPSMVSAA